MTGLLDHTVVDVPMPQLGVSVLEGTVLEWRVAVGEAIREDDALCDVATDKVDSEVPAPVTGVLAEILVPPGETVEVGVLIARIAVAEPPGPPGRPDPTPAPAGPRFTPAVRRLVRLHGLDLAGTVGSGRAGRVTRRDVEALLARVAAPATEIDPTPAPPVHDPEPAVAPPIAEPGRRSYGHTWVEVDMTRAEAERRSTGTPALPLVAHAAVAALRRHPVLGGGSAPRAVDLGLVLGLETGSSVVPVVRNANDLSLQGLAARIADLSARAATGRLAPEELRGATFTIVDTGAHGALMSTPVAHPPQVAALSVGAVGLRPVAVPWPDGTDALVIRPTVTLGLAWDDQLLDGVAAARFLATLRDTLESLPRAAGPGS